MNKNKKEVMDMHFKQAMIALLVVMLSLSPLSALSKKKPKTYVAPSWCQVEGYHCVRVKGGQSWKTLFPDETERGIVMRINRSNQTIYSGLYIMVPNNVTETTLLDHSPFPLAIEAPNEKLVVVDLGQNAWGAFDADGSQVRWGPATGGKDYCPDTGRGCRTKAGVFRVYSMGSSNCVSSKFPIPKGGAPMPYCMFFNGGQALHGSPGQVMKGNASHGCVRLFVPDAEWLRYDFMEPPMESNNYRGTKVVVLPY